MSFTLLRGIYKPNTGIPDEDTVRFAPNNPDLLFSLPHRACSSRINTNNGTVSLRYEGIDTLEKDAIEPLASDATTDFDNMVKIDGTQIRLIAVLEDLIFTS